MVPLSSMQAGDANLVAHLPKEQAVCSRFCSCYDPKGSTDFNRFQQDSPKSLNRK
jgi:hypothetical protein